MSKQPTHGEDATENVETEQEERLADDYQRILTDNMDLRQRLNEIELHEQFFIDKNDRVSYYTGLPNYLSLKCMFDKLVSSYIPDSSLSKISKFQKFVMTLMRLRLNVQVQDLSYRFGISTTNVSSTFKTVLHVLYISLKRFIVWPEREQLRKTMPLSFRKHFGLKVACIIDCFEIFIERPSNLFARQNTWSNYKHMNTVKYLIGICPQGSVSFISKGYGGKTTDKTITEKSDFLNNLLPGDLVLADRGFNVSESVGLMCAEVKIPAFTRGKKQLSSLDIESTRKIANSRVHVERVIGLVRNKYAMLRSKLPIDFLHNDADGIPPIDKMVVVACALCNWSPSIVPFD